MKYLLLLRHGKAANLAGEDDFERPLLAQGQTDIRKIATWLGAHGLMPQRALVSEARRARESWEIIAAAALADSAAGQQSGIAADIRHALYLAGPGEILAALQDTPYAVERLIVIGHNPGLEALARALTGRGSDSRALLGLARGMPPAGLAVFEFDGGDWSQLGAAASRLTHFV